MTEDRCGDCGGCLPLSPSYGAHVCDREDLRDALARLTEEVEALRAERDSLRATLAAAASEVARESAKREARIESLLQELDKAHAERKTSEEYGCAAREETVRLSEALDEAKRRFEQIRETAKNASRTFQSVVDRAEKAERELAGSRELLIEWVRYGYRMGMEGTDETGDADCKCLACRSSARLGRSE